MRPLALIDVGSTVIKSVIFNPDGAIDQGFHTRTEKKTIVEQVGELTSEWTAHAPAQLEDTPEVRICSSANKGLRVGLVCITSRYSGAASAHCLETVGSNIVYLHEARDPPSTPPLHVDVLVVVGGVDGYPSGAMTDALKAMALGAWPHDKLVFAGHRACWEWVQAAWPKAILVDNPLNSGLRLESVALADLVRETYLDDIESKREMGPLRAYTDRPIEPTPAVVSRAFQRMIENRRGPDLLLDVGGATTDIHYTKELFDDDADSASLATHQTVGRYVYTGYGVFESRASTIDALLKHQNCHDFLTALYGADQRQVYVDLIDHVIASDLLFYACIFLALSNLSEGRKRTPHAPGAPAPPPLNLQRAVSLGLTGGAAKNTKSDDLARVLIVATGARIEPVIDKQYRWWTLGLLDDREIKAIQWEKFDV